MHVETRLLSQLRRKNGFGVITMKFCYYVLWNETKDVTGPMPLKEALKFKEEHEWIQPMSILKLVIDEDGKEVK